MHINDDDDLRGEIKNISHNNEDASSKIFLSSLDMFLNYADDDCNIDSSLTEGYDDINETRRNSLTSLASTSLTNSEIAHVANYIFWIQ